MTQSIAVNRFDASMNPMFIIAALLNTAGEFCNNNVLVMIMFLFFKFRVTVDS